MTEYETRTIVRDTVKNPALEKGHKNRFRERDVNVHREARYRGDVWWAPADDDEQQKKVQQAGWQEQGDFI